MNKKILQKRTNNSIIKKMLKIFDTNPENLKKEPFDHYNNINGIEFAKRFYLRRKKNLRKYQEKEITKNKKKIEPAIIQVREDEGVIPVTPVETIVPAHPDEPLIQKQQKAVFIFANNIVSKYDLSEEKTTYKSTDNYNILWKFRNKTSRKPELTNGVITADKKYIYMLKKDGCSGTDGILKISARRRMPINFTKTTKPINHMFITPNGEFLITSDGSNEKLTKWSTASMQPVSSTTSFNSLCMKSLVISNDSQSLFVGHSDGQVSIFDLKNDKNIENFKVFKNPIQQIKVTENDKYIYIFSEDNYMKVYDLVNSQLSPNSKKLIDELSPIINISFADNQKGMVVALESGTVFAYNLKEYEIELKVQFSKLAQMCIINDGNNVFLCEEGNQIYGYSMTVIADHTFYYDLNTINKFNREALVF